MRMYDGNNNELCVFSQKQDGIDILNLMITEEDNNGDCEKVLCFPLDLSQCNKLLNYISNHINNLPQPKRIEYTNKYKEELKKMNKEDLLEVERLLEDK